MYFCIAENILLEGNNIFDLGKGRGRGGLKDGQVRMISLGFRVWRMIKNIENDKNVMI